MAASPSRGALPRVSEVGEEDHTDSGLGPGDHRDGGHGHREGGHGPVRVGTDGSQGPGESSQGRNGDPDDMGTAATEGGLSGEAAEAAGETGSGTASPVVGEAADGITVLPVGTAADEAAEVAKSLGSEGVSAEEENS